MKKERIAITRVAYCENCHKAKRPQLGQRYITLGSSHKELHIHQVENRTPFGFSPHLFVLVKLEKNIVHFTSMCCMDECDVRIAKEQNERGKYNISYEYASVGTMPLVEWNNMILNPDLGYKLGK